jgi:hypothetical protein
VVTSCRRFPVHNVTLYVREMPESSRPQQFGAVGRVKLDRDATIGLGEYAPGNEVVAGGRIWTSAGVVRHSHEFMPQQSYIVCDHCQRVDIRLNYAEHPKECEQCGSRLKWMPGGRNGKFISPTGFTTSVAERKGRSPARHRLRAPGTDEARLVTMVPLNMFERTDLHSVESAFAAGCPDPDSSQLAGELFVVNKGRKGMGYRQCLNPVCDYVELAKTLTPSPSDNGDGQRGIRSPHKVPATGKQCRVGQVSLYARLHAVLPQPFVDEMTRVPIEEAPARMCEVRVSDPLAPRHVSRLSANPEASDKDPLASSSVAARRKSARSSWPSPNAPAQTRQR